MISVVRQGAAWTVVRDGRLMREGAGAAVHKTRERAEQQAARLGAKLQEEVHLSASSVPPPDEPASS